MSPDWASNPQAVPYASYANPQSLNLYSYLRNNPVGGTDPEGHWPILNLFDPSTYTRIGSNLKSVGIGLAKVAVNTINFIGGDCICQAAVQRNTPTLAPSNAMEAATMIVAPLAAGAIGPVVDAAFGGSATVTASAPGAIETESVTTSGYIGDNIVQGSGRVNSDLPGGQSAAQDTFSQKTAGQNSQTMANGHTVAEGGTRLRNNADGTARVDRPASVTGDQHETVHFNTPDKQPQ